MEGAKERRRGGEEKEQRMKKKRGRKEKKRNKKERTRGRQKNKFEVWAVDVKFPSKAEQTHPKRRKSAVIWALPSYSQQLGLLEVDHFEI